MCFEEWTGVGFSGSTRTLWRAGAGGSLLRGILISVNYSRKWHVLLTSALSSRRSGRIQFSRPPARSFLLRRVDLVARERRCRRRRRCRRGSNRRVLPRDARRLILSPKHTLPRRAKILIASFSATRITPLLSSTTALLPATLPRFKSM